MTWTWDFTNKKVLVVGIGGGSDIIAAFAISEQIKNAKNVAYGNTKEAPIVDEAIVNVAGCRFVYTISGDLPHSGRVSHGTVDIDRMIPKGINNCPYVFVISPSHKRQLADEIKSLGYDTLIAVDIGGDSLTNWWDRDKMMLEVLEATGLPMQHLVIAPGIDGESDEKSLETAMTLCEEAFSLEPLNTVFHRFGRLLDPSRTPNLILRASQIQLPEERYVRVPRMREPFVKLAWLKRAYLVNGYVKWRGHNYSDFLQRMKG